MKRLALFLLILVCGGPALASDSTLITHVRLIDGSGLPAVEGALRFANGRIVALGTLEPLEGETVIDGEGQVLAPGFIDSHSHFDDGIQEQRSANSAVGQGVTTAIVGQDGGSEFPLKDWFAALEAHPVAINFASYSGHNSIRERVMGADYTRHASDAEIEAMGEMLQADLDAGALGLGTGLEYEPGIYSDPAEVMALARIAAAAGGRYISHVRSEDRWFWKAIDEIIAIGRETGMPVQVSHIKLAMKSHWGKADELVARLNAARAEGINISADIYPYTYWQSNIMVLIPSRDVTAREEFEYALAEIAPPEGFWITEFEPEPELVGMKLTDIAVRRGTDPVTALMQMAAEVEATDGNNMMIGTSMTEDDIATLMAWDYTSICTDGGLVDLHPRGAASYPRVLGRYVRERGVLGLEEAVHRMTGLPARQLGIEGRGLLKAGLAADLVLFDPETILDNATPESPQAPNTGISRVWVNGVQVYRDGNMTGQYPGQVIRRAAP